MDFTVSNLFKRSFIRCVPPAVLSLPGRGPLQQIPAATFYYILSSFARRVHDPPHRPA